MKDYLADLERENNNLMDQLSELTESNPLSLIIIRELLESLEQSAIPKI
jgi:hypothetical protein